MSKTYKVFLTTVATAWVEVKADDKDAAIDEALDNAPYAPGFANYEFGEWEVGEDGVEETE